MTVQQSANMTLFGCWLMHAEQGTLDKAGHIALSKTLMRTGNGAILSVEQANFDFKPHLREYVVRCKDGRTLTLWALNRGIVRAIVGHHNVDRIFE